MRKVVPGKAGKGYGVQVAGPAGLPRPLAQRAEEILKEYKWKSNSKSLHQKEVLLEVR